MTVLRIATRSSLQARTQAEYVGGLIEKSSPGTTVEYVYVDTQGDLNATTPLHQMGGQGIFVKSVLCAAWQFPTRRSHLRLLTARAPASIKQWG
jgi:porphobilinogen deaminase